MKDLLLLGVIKFLQERLSPGQPLLLGYSGGPDSKALLYLLLACRRLYPFDLLLAHVDHGWRDGSQREADLIRHEARGLEVELFVNTLSLADFKEGNLEEQGREHRLRFFLDIYQRYHCQALVLGHHADDQAEVVLKRVFEGASLFNLKGLEKDAMLMQMRVWRPLLFVPKKQVIAWLYDRGLEYFVDPTNLHSQFLRGRMRQEILPQLAQAFGKQVCSNLCRLAQEAKDVKTYFSQMNKPMLERIQPHETGGYLDLKPFLPLASLQIRYFLIEWMKKEGVTFSFQILNGVAGALSEAKTKKKFQSKKGAFFVNKEIVHFFRG